MELRATGQAAAARVPHECPRWPERCGLWDERGTDVALDLLCADNKRHVVTCVVGSQREVRAVATRRQGLIALRKAAGYTQEALAAEMYIDRSTIVRWECGENEPQPHHRPKLARLLGVSADELRRVLTEPDYCVSPAPAAVELPDSAASVFDRRAV